MAVAPASAAAAAAASSSWAWSRVCVRVGGRSSAAGVCASVLGGSGFAGRYVVDRLGRLGARVLAAHRGGADSLDARHLRPLADVGQLGMTPLCVRDPRAILQAVQGADLVVNLVGRSYETRNYSFDDVHVRAAGDIAEAAQAAGVQRFVHFSALGADVDSSSAFLRSKAHGELAVLRAFPNATILRPAVMFGWEDNFVNRYAKWARQLPIVPLVAGGANRIQPVFVEDVADAVMAVINRSEARGSVYEIGGPDQFQLRDVLRLICDDLELRNNTITMPPWQGRLYAALLELSPWPPLLTRDEINQMSTDIVVSNNAKTLASLGIAATSLREKLHMLLSMYRSNRSYVETSQR